jgi:hypothetical protein
MSASTLDPAVTRLSNPALITDAMAKAQIFDFVPARNFRVEIALEDSSAVNPALDLTSAVVEWKFTPVDPDDFVDDDVYLDEVDGESDSDLDQDDEDSDLEAALDEESDEDEDAVSEVLGFLDLTFLLSKDTLIQSALLRESACISTTIVIGDNNDVPMAQHTFVGFIYQEDILPVGSSDTHTSKTGSFMTSSVRIRIFDCVMWSLL